MGEEIRMTRQGKIPECYSSKLIKVLEVFKDESTNIPLKILQSFDNLEKLVLKLCSYKEILSCGAGEKPHRMVTRIKVLQLLGLLNLNRMWQQDSQLDSVLEILEILEVHFCHNLITLVPSLAFFEHLKTLDVYCCDGLRNLGTFSMAKSLKQFEEMTIEGCEELTEIIENGDDDEATDEIFFSKLREMSLFSLKRITSFCSGNYAFNFPALSELRVEKCPKMKTFSRGTSITPSLEKINWSKNYWKGDINTSIQQLAKEKYGQSFEKDLGQPSTSQPPV